MAKENDKIIGSYSLGPTSIKLACNGERTVFQVYHAEQKKVNELPEVTLVHDGKDLYAAKNAFTKCVTEALNKTNTEAVRGVLERS